MLIVPLPNSFSFSESGSRLSASPASHHWHFHSEAVCLPTPKGDLNSYTPRSVYFSCLFPFRFYTYMHTNTLTGQLIFSLTSSLSPSPGASFDTHAGSELVDAYNSKIKRLSFQKAMVIPWHVFFFFLHPESSKFAAAFFVCVCVCVGGGL